MEKVFKSLVWSCERGGLKVGLDNASRACEEAEGEDEYQGCFGDFVDLQFQDDGNRDQGEDDVGDDIDDRIEKADVGVCFE